MEQNIIKDNDMRLISIPEACDRLKICRWKVYKLINNKSLKTVKIGGSRRVRIGALNEFIASMEQ